jgi:hypothetical protein
LVQRVVNFKCDIAALARHFEQMVRPTPCVECGSDGLVYDGWAVTSRDGSIEDGVRRVSPEDGHLPPVRTAIIETPHCTGVVKQALDDLSALGFYFYRARIMRMCNEGRQMVFHRDEPHRAWRLNIPIITHPHCYFEWKVVGRLRRIHLPADGSAWVVRVDQLHRAVNEGDATAERVHLFMDLAGDPPRGAVAPITKPMATSRDECARAGLASSM